MDKEFAIKVAEALRSGRFKQGRGKLRSHDDRFCCLGVMCEVHPDVRWTKYRPSRDESSYSPLLDGVKVNTLTSDISIDENTLNDTYPNRLISRGLMGLDRDAPDRPGCALGNRLWKMNDSGMSFDQIADYIEEWIINV